MTLGIESAKGLLAIQTKTEYNNCWRMWGSSDEDRC